MRVYGTDNPFNHFYAVRLSNTVQVEAAKRQAEVEQSEYDELLKWLDQADERP